MSLQHDMKSSFLDLPLPGHLLYRCVLSCCGDAACVRVYLCAVSGGFCGYIIHKNQNFPNVTKKIGSIPFTSATLSCRTGQFSLAEPTPR